MEDSGSWAAMDGRQHPPSRRRCVNRRLRSRSQISRVTEIRSRHHIELPASAQNAKGGKAVLYVAVADNKAESHVTRGENGGRNLAHVGVTRVLKQVGTIDLESAFAKDVTLSVQPGAGSNGIRLVVFIQDPRSGQVLGVAAQKL